MEGVRLYSILECEQVVADVVRRQQCGVFDAQLIRAIGNERPDEVLVILDRFGGKALNFTEDQGNNGIAALGCFLMQVGCHGHARPHREIEVQVGCLA